MRSVRFQEEGSGILHRNGGKETSLRVRSKVASVGRKYRFQPYGAFICLTKLEYTEEPMI